MRSIFFYFLAGVAALTIPCALYLPQALWVYLIIGPILVIGIWDLLQTKKTILRNFPVIGHFRYILEKIRPEIQQYFIESNISGRPFHREDRSLIYQRSKKALDTLPFGTQKNLYEVGYEWVNHSMRPVHVNPEDLRITVGGPDCQQPYNMSILNISAMSFGALSGPAITALNQGAKMGNFAHNTGEGGISQYHKQGGDLIWQIGTGYFGCRTPDGNFCEKSYIEQANLDQVKMIELKISQGAKPGHGGILPAAKVNHEIAQARGVPVGEDVLSPPGHKAFSTPIEMMEFIKKLRDLSKGKPVGFKICVGKRREFLALCKAMIQTGVTPDFISVDGGEGGTGAAPIEFSNHIGCPLVEGLIFVHNALVGSGLRERIKIIASSKVSTGFGMIKRIAVGADACYSARAMMMSLGCIQALKCNTNECPTGVATQDTSLSTGLVVKEKNKRVANFHKETIKSVAEMLGSMGLTSSEDLNPWHIMRRVNFTDVKHYGELYRYLEPADLIKGTIPGHFQRAWDVASPKTFEHVGAY